MRVFLRSEGLKSFETHPKHAHIATVAVAQELIEHASSPGTVFIDSKDHIRPLHIRTGTRVHASDGHTLEITSFDPLQLRLLPLSESELLPEEGQKWIDEHLNDAVPLVLEVGPLLAEYTSVANDKISTRCFALRANLEDIVGKFAILHTTDGKQFGPSDGGGFLRHVFYTKCEKFVHFARLGQRFICERFTPVIDEATANAFFGLPEAPKPPTKPKNPKGNGNGKSDDNTSRRTSSSRGGPRD